MLTVQFTCLHDNAGDNTCMYKIVHTLTQKFKVFVLGIKGINIAWFKTGM